MKVIKMIDDAILGVRYIEVEVPESVTDITTAADIHTAKKAQNRYGAQQQMMKRFKSQHRNKTK